MIGFFIGREFYCNLFFFTDGFILMGILKRMKISLDLFFLKVVNERISSTCIVYDSSGFIKIKETSLAVCKSLFFSNNSLDALTVFFR